MTPVEPSVHEGAELRLLAADQPPYAPLPASVDRDGLVMTEWELADDEFERLLSGGRVRLWLHTAGDPVQPMNVEIVAPELGAKES